MSAILSFTKLYAVIVAGSVDCVVYGISAGSEPVPLIIIFVTSAIDADSAVMSAPFAVYEEVVTCAVLVNLILSDTLVCIAGSDPVPNLIILVIVEIDELITVASALPADDAEVTCGVFVNLILSDVLDTMVGSEPVPVEIIFVTVAKDELILVTSGVPAPDADVYCDAVVNLIFSAVFKTRAGSEPVPFVITSITNATEELILVTSVALAVADEVTCAVPVYLILSEVFRTNVGSDPVPLLIIRVTRANELLTFVISALDAVTEPVYGVILLTIILFTVLFTNAGADPVP